MRSGFSAFLPAQPNLCFWYCGNTELHPFHSCSHLVWRSMLNRKTGSYFIFSALSCGVSFLLTPVLALDGAAEQDSLKGHAESQGLTGTTVEQILQGDVEQRTLQGGAQQQVLTGGAEQRVLTGGTSTRLLNGSIKDEAPTESVAYPFAWRIRQIARSKWGTNGQQPMAGQVNQFAGNQHFLPGQATPTPFSRPGSPLNAAAGWATHPIPPVSQLYAHTLEMV